MPNDSVQFHHLRSLDAMYDAVALQQTFWGNDCESVIPAHMLFSIASYGGHVTGAFVDDKLVGILVGLLGTDTTMSDRPALANLQLFSKRMVVLPEYRNYGLGYRLKLAQRDFAIAQGIRLVVWTYDPVMSLNAYLNIRKLGGVSQSYREDYYGTRNVGGLSPLGTSDRLGVDWWVTKNRVRERVEGGRKPLSLSQYTDSGTQIVNPASTNSGGFAVPPETVEAMIGEPFQLVEVPSNFPQIAQSDVELAKDWQFHIREVLGGLIRKGYTVTDFMTSEEDGRKRSYYLLSTLQFDDT